MAERIFLLLGSNLGNRHDNLSRAIVLIKQEAGKILAVSSIYETAAWGKRDQSDFLNQVVELESSLNPEALLSLLLTIEQKIGRVRHEKWGARSIDIDILYYGDQKLSSEALTLPHPGIPDRRFVLVPLCELAAEFTHPILNKKNKQLLLECTDPLLVKRID